MALSLLPLRILLSLYNARINGDVVVVVVISTKFESLPFSLLSVVMLSGGVRRSKPHVAENLYTTKNTKKLIMTRTQAVMNFANKFSPDSLGSSGR